MQSITVSVNSLKGKKWLLLALLVIFFYWLPSVGYAAYPDYKVLKYDSSGNPDPVWGANGISFDSGGADIVADGATDSSGNTYITGYYYSSDSGFYTADVRTMKYSPTGTSLWGGSFGKRYAGVYEDFAEAVVADPSSIPN